MGDPSDGMNLGVLGWSGKHALGERVTSSMGMGPDPGAAACVALVSIKQIGRRHRR
jgi:hypothetical protein